MRRSVLAALAALLASLAATPAAAQPSSARRAARDPSQARALSMIFPGLGHLYAGDRARGAALAGVGAAGLGVLAADCAPRDCAVPPATGLGVAALAAYAAAWVYGVRDADDAARRHNAASAARVGAYVAPALGGVRAGLRLTLGATPAR